MALRVYITQSLDFGRYRRIYLLDESVDLAKPIDKYEGYLLTPTGDGMGVKRTPIKEGERLPESAAFFEANDRVMDEFLKSMATELVRLGYVTGDPHGTKMKAVEEHLKTMHKENDRHFDLLAKFVDAVTPILRSNKK